MPKKLTEKKGEALAAAAGIPEGGILELSEWGGEFCGYTRRELRNHAAKVVPETVEGLWFAVAVIRAMAAGKVALGFDDAGLRQAAKALSQQIDKAKDLYDS